MIRHHLLQASGDALIIGYASTFIFRIGGRLSRAAGAIIILPGRYFRFLRVPPRAPQLPHEYACLL